MTKPDRRHPCGNLPVSTWAITVWYCHEHAAWFAAHGGSIEDGGDYVKALYRYTEVEFGPFDTATDVQHWIQSQLPNVRKLNVLPARD